MSLKLKAKTFALADMLQNNEEIRSRMLKVNPIYNVRGTMYDSLKIVVDVIMGNMVSENKRTSHII
jgi:hypothetical protein